MSPVLGGISDQVAEDMLEVSFVAVDRRKIATDLAFEPPPRALAGMPM